VPKIAFVDVWFYPGACWESLQHSPKLIAALRAKKGREMGKVSGGKEVERETKRGMRGEGLCSSKKSF